MAPKKDTKKKPEEEAPKIYKGIYLNKGYWRARIWNKDCEVYLGHFPEPEQAAAAYDKAAIKLRGLQSALNDLLNLDEERYKPELDSIMDKPFEVLVQELRASGVQDINK